MIFNECFESQSYRKLIIAHIFKLLISVVGIPRHCSDTSYQDEVVFISFP